MIFLGILAFMVLAGPAVVLAKRMNRPVRSGGAQRGSPGSSGAAKTKTGGTSKATGKASKASKAGKAGTGSGRGSWVIKAWNASGAPRTTETTLKGASAVVTGKAVGTAARGTVWAGRKLRRGSASAGGRALTPVDRWLDRTQAALENAATTPTRRPTDPTVPDPTPTTGRRYGSPAGPGPELYQPGKDPEHDRELTEFKLATKKQWLEDSIKAFEGLKADGLVSPDAEAEHMKHRRRLQGEIEELRRALNTPSKPTPAASPPPVHTNPFRSNKGEPVSTDAPSFDRSAVPSTIATHLNYIADLHPENDAEILNFLQQEVTGMLAYAEAVNTMFEHCVTGEGLDPAAMQGVSDYAEAFAENATAAAGGHKQFLAVYEAIIEAANNGTVMPFNGRFFSGESAA